MHMRGRLLTAAFLAALALLPAASAKGTQEDPATYPPGVTSITRTDVLPRTDFDVLVNTASYEQATMVLCRFEDAADVEPVVCWTNIKGAAVEDAGFTIRSADGPHPPWDAGWTIGYKVVLKSGALETHAPAPGTVEGEYYKVLVEAPAEAVEGAGQEAPDKASPAPAVGAALVALALAAARRRRD
jgi:MYXO-CTERM domain-containing protein